MNAMKQYSRWVMSVFLSTLTITEMPVISAGEPKPVEPYSMYVATSEAFVRCGPSDEYYRTDTLIPGDSVDVYVESEDGWLGIRPPETSFSWIPAAHVQLTDNPGVAIVEHTKAVAWVGTNLGTAKKYRWQVRLTPGEQLAVLGEVQRESATGEPELWLKVVPPAGEFRWIHLRDVARTPDAADHRVAKIIETSKLSSQLAASDDETNATDPVVQPASFNAPVGSSVQPKAMEPSSPRNVVPGEVMMAGGINLKAIPGSEASAAETSPKSIDTDASESLPVPVAQLAPAPPPADIGEDWQQARRSLAAAPVLPIEKIDSADVEELQLMLAQQMAAGASAEAVEPLRGRSVAWVERLIDPVERGRARLLAERIERYQEVARSRTRGGVAPAISGDQTTTAASDANKPFDQTGYLVQVYSARPEAPPFALTDRSGRTLAYIAPAPGVNLRRYLNQEVGLYGRTGYLTGLDTPYLMAEKVVKVAGLRR